MVKPNERILGLDILRSIAIFMVVIQHSSKLIGHSIYFGIDGVDLFFVLSGFLVGQILIKQVENTDKIDVPVVLNFLKRRWFRTLPNYFLFLLINILLIHAGLIKGALNKYLITYPFFLQNFFKPYDFLFWESWSLSVEEWFYLLFPLLLWILYQLFSNKISTRKSLLITITLFITLPLVYRLTNNPHLNFDLYTRRMVPARLDTIGYGLLAAYLHRYFNNWWQAKKHILFITGAAMLFTFSLHPFQLNYYIKSLNFSFWGLAIAMMLPELEQIKKEKIPGKPIRFISRISYSMYLVHIPLFQLWQLVIDNRTLGCYFLYWSLVIIISYGIYQWFEKPMMNLRNVLVIEYNRKNKLRIKKSVMNYGLKNESSD